MVDILFFRNPRLACSCTYVHQLLVLVPAELPEVLPGCLCSEFSLCLGHDLFRAVPNVGCVDSGTDLLLDINRARADGVVKDSVNKVNCLRRGRVYFVERGLCSPLQL